ncbi:hypothetical protein [Paenibacillus sp. BT-177]|uniref:hypothetical protein n=1 Tax=Paenibacillus sp. BT-177 TaxID=2986930 RepID=UPI0021F6E369|nr:hypothetical protein [Paenibacillus sp. BT-177]
MHDALQVQRYDQHCAEQRELYDPRQNDAACKIRRFERFQLQQRLLLCQFHENEKDERNAADGQARDRRSLGPAGAAFAYTIRQHGEGDRREAHADDVQIRRLMTAGFRQIFIPEN